MKGSRGEEDKNKTKNKDGLSDNKETNDRKKSRTNEQKIKILKRKENRRKNNK
jgi:hypothetical protein